MLPMVTTGGGVMHLSAKMKGRKEVQIGDQWSYSRKYGHPGLKLRLILDKSLVNQYNVCLGVELHGH